MRILEILITRTRGGPVLPYEQTEEEGWDKLWTTYFEREPNQRQHQSELRMEALPANKEEMVDELYLQAPPEAIRDRTVLEVGSGAGFLAKRIAVFTKHYIGVEWSGLALSVARDTCPERATFYHPLERKAMRRHAGTVDTVLCRQFMIHQKFDRAVAVLTFDAAMLRSGGVVYADFWLDEPSRHNGKGVWNCREDGPPRNAVYRYGDDDVAEIAQRSGLVVDDVYDRPDKLRHFVTFRKP